MSFIEVTLPKLDVEGAGHADAGITSRDHIDAEDAAASYLTRALFLAQTMRKPSVAKRHVPFANLLQSKRERVCKLVNRSDAPEIRADFHGLALHLALVGVGTWFNTHVGDHGIPDTVLAVVEGRLREKFSKPTSARNALVEFLDQHAPAIDPSITRKDLVARLVEQRLLLNLANQSI